MKSEDIKRYTFYGDEEAGVVVALSTFAKKPVRGVAKCDPRDEFSMSDGMELAAARCNARIAKKRARRAEQKLNDARRALEEAEKHYKEMTLYFIDSNNKLINAKAELEELEASYRGD